MRIPAGTSSHSVLTLSGRGFKRLDAYQGHGDHFVNLKIRIPSHLTEEQKEIIKEYAYLEKDTPGTVTGIDRSRPKPSARHRQSASESETDQSGFNTQSQQNSEVEPEQQEGFFSKLKKKLLG